MAQNADQPRTSVGDAIKRGVQQEVQGAKNDVTAFFGGAVTDLFVKKGTAAKLGDLAQQVVGEAKKVLNSEGSWRDRAAAAVTSIVGLVDKNKDTLRDHAKSSAENVINTAAKNNGKLGFIATVRKVISGYGKREQGSLMDVVTEKATQHAGGLRAAVAERAANEGGVVSKTVAAAVRSRFPNLTAEPGQAGAPKATPAPGASATKQNER